MKIKPMCSKEKQQEFMDACQRGEITFASDGELLLMEPSILQDAIYVKDHQDFIRIKIMDIIYLEALANIIEVHTKAHTYTMRESLYVLEAQLCEFGFLRIHKSFVINKAKIQRIRPGLHMKYTLLMEGGEQLEVSRSYYYTFKEEIGF